MNDFAGWPIGVARAWGLVAAASRGPRARFALADVVAAGIKLADAESLAAVSLPRVAATLGLSQNALYRYVGGKDELVVLMEDAVVADLPDLDPALEWREAARQWALAVSAAYRRRPWLLDVPVRAPVTPNAMRWLEALLRALRDTPLDVVERVQCATLLDGHARAMATLGRDLSPAEAAYPPALVARILPLLAEGGSTELVGFFAAIAETGKPDEPAGSSVDEEADFGLERILDGIAVLIAQRSPN